MTLLVVSAPAAQALIMGIQAVVATCLLASLRSVDNAAEQPGTPPVRPPPRQGT